MHAREILDVLDRAESFLKKLRYILRYYDISLRTPSYSDDYLFSMWFKDTPIEFIDVMPDYVEVVLRDEYVNRECIPDEYRGEKYIKFRDMDELVSFLKQVLKC